MTEFGSERAPLSFLQEQFFRLWPGSLPYFKWPVALRLEGPVDPGALAAAVNAFVARHGALRTGFERDGEHIVQHVAGDVSCELATIDLSPLGPRERDAEWRRLASQDMLFEFELARPPLVKPTLIRSADDDHVLLLTCSHLVADAASRPTLARDLSALYSAFAGGDPATALPAAVPQYAEFARDQRRHAGTGAQAAALAAWERSLAQVQPTSLPVDRAGPARDDHRGLFLGSWCGAPLVRASKELARRERVSLFVVLLAAVKALLRCGAGHDDVTVAITWVGRPAGMKEAVGFFATLLPIHTVVPEAIRFRDLLARVRRSFTDAVAHAESASVLRIDPGLLEVVVSFVNFRPAQWSLPGVRVSPVALVAPRGGPDDRPLESRSAQTALALALQDRGDAGLAANWRYKPALFDDNTIEGIARRFQAGLAHAVVRPDDPIARWPR